MFRRQDVVELIAAAIEGGARLAALNEDRVFLEKRRQRRQDIVQARHRRRQGDGRIRIGLAGDGVSAFAADGDRFSGIEDDPKRPGQPRIGLSLKATLQDPFVAHLGDMGRGKRDQPQKPVVL